MAFGITPNGESIYVYPVGDSLKPYINEPMSLSGGEIYSVFLSGDKSSVDTLMVKENPPAFYPDSAVGVRVINLCKGSGG